MPANKFRSQESSPLNEWSGIQIPHIRCDRRHTDVNVDIGDSRSSPILPGSFSALQNSSLDHHDRRLLQYRFWYSHTDVLHELCSMNGGFFLAKLLLCIFFVFLGIISLKTLSTQ